MWVKAAEALHALMAVYSFALRVFDYCHSGVAHVYSSDPNTPPNISAALHAVFVQVYMLILITDTSGTCGQAVYRCDSGAPPTALLVPLCLYNYLQLFLRIST